MHIVEKERQPSLYSNKTIWHLLKHWKNLIHLDIALTLENNLNFRLNIWHKAFNMLHGMQHLSFSFNSPEFWQLSTPLHFILNHHICYFSLTIISFALDIKSSNLLFNWSTVLFSLLLDCWTCNSIFLIYLSTILNLIHCFQGLNYSAHYECLLSYYTSLFK